MLMNEKQLFGNPGRDFQPPTSPESGYNEESAVLDSRSVMARDIGSAAAIRAGVEAPAPSPRDLIMKNPVGPHYTPDRSRDVFTPY